MLPAAAALWWVQWWAGTGLAAHLPMKMGRLSQLVADRAGFEPAVAVTPRTLSKRVP